MCVLGLFFRTLAVNSVSEKKNYLLSCSSPESCYFFCLIFFSACWPIFLSCFFTKKFSTFFLLETDFFVRLLLYAAIWMVDSYLMLWAQSTTNNYIRVENKLQPMHSYNVVNFLLHLSIPFYTWTNLVVIKRRKGPRYQLVLASSAISTGAIPKGLIPRKCCVWCLYMYILFYIYLCQDWLCRF